MIMSRRASVLQILSENRAKFREVGVAKMGVFGSVARGEDVGHSDVDVFVELAPDINRARSFHRICDLLDDLIGEPYDVVTKDGLSPYFGPKILNQTLYVELAS